MLNLTKAIIESVDKDNYENNHIEFVKYNNYKYNGYHKLFEATLKDCADQVLEDFKSLDLNINQIINLLSFFNSFYFDSNKGYAKEKDEDEIIYYLSKLFTENINDFINFIKKRKEKEERVYAPFYVYNIKEEFRKEFILKVCKDLNWFKNELLDDCIRWSIEPFYRNEKFNKDKRIKDYDNYCITDDDLLYLYTKLSSSLDESKITKYIDTSDENSLVNFNLIANDNFKDKAIELIKIYSNIIFRANCEKNYSLNFKKFKEILDIDVVDYIRPKSIKEIDYFEKIFGSCKYSILKNSEYEE